MQRRDFLQSTSLVTLGLTLSPSLALNAQPVTNAPRSMRGHPLEMIDRVLNYRKPARSIKMHVPGFLWIDAADFKDYGGWVYDTQFAHLMGSGFLLAAGTAAPVEDAKTQFHVNQAGTYRVWVRARNWIPEHAPGRFQLKVDGKTLPKTFGAAPSDAWLWESGGEVTLGKGAVDLTLHDLTGYFGRCDSILLTRDLDYTPPTDLESFKAERNRLAGIPTTPKDLGEFDVVVVGAGSGGCPAAIEAARSGAKVALISDRPLLGGNAGSELGIKSEGAARKQCYGRETGINEEAGRMRALHKLLLYCWPFEKLCKAEPNLTLVLNTRLVGAKKRGNKIEEVTLQDPRSLELSKMRGKMFVDASGDAWLAYHAGAEYRMGREARSEFNEEFAPEKEDNITMSGCLIVGNRTGFGMWVAEDMKKPVPFEPLPWAANFPKGELHRDLSRAYRRGGWWTEHPGTLDDIWEAEKARDELLRIHFGLWDYIKNKWDQKDKAANLKMVFSGYMNAKRENRRIVGDYILKESDVRNAVDFPDSVAYNGWSIDIHHPEGIYSGAKGPFDVMHRVPISQTPLRCLYSKNVPNLMMAGRNISVSHIALGTTRVQQTIALAGQAVGAAAAYAVKRKILPRDIVANHMQAFQQLLLKRDVTIPKVTNQDPQDLARNATVTASSEKPTFEIDRKEILITSWNARLDTPNGIILPWGRIEKLKKVHVALKATGKAPDTVTLRLHLRTAEGPHDTSSEKDILVIKKSLKRNTPEWPANKEKQWVTFEVDAHMPQSSHIWVWLDKAPGFQWLNMKNSLPNASTVVRKGDQWLQKKIDSVEPYFGTELEPPVHYPHVYAPDSIINGTSRHWQGAPNQWCSNSAAKLPQWVQLNFNRNTTLNRIQLTFDTDLKQTLHNVPKPPRCVKKYRLEYREQGKWKTIAEEDNNYQRWRIHTFAPIRTDKLRLTVLETHGDPCARVYEIRAYNEAT